LPYNSDPGRTQHVLVERLTNFNDHLRLGGYGYFPRRRLLSIDLTLNDGRHVDIPGINLPSPELTRKFGPGAAACRFSALLPAGQLSMGQLGGDLRFYLDDGRTIRHRIDLGDPSDDSPSMMREFQQLLAQRPSGHMLEIGSRERTGNNYRYLLPPNWDYVGFDIMQGPNVDIVGDAHKASSFLPKGHFDAAMSYAVFEHLLMPWKAVIELNRVMATGGVGFILAPQTWPLHEEPADYFRFSRHSWKALFNRATGFEIIRATDNGKAYIIPYKQVPSTAFGEHWTGALMSAVLFRKIGETSLDWPVDMDDISEDQYPI
jgi:hypothetical protein